jgi:hypothetical protein
MITPRMKIMIFNRVRDFGERVKNVKTIKKIPIPIKIIERIRFSSFAIENRLHEIIIKIVV